MNLKKDSTNLFNVHHNPIFSIILPTYNESNNIIKLLNSINTNISNSINFEIIVVDDNSPDGTGKLVDEYIKSMNHYENKESTINIRIIHRKQKEGLIKAILEGIRDSSGEKILVMDADFSHPPEIIPKIVEIMQNNDNCIVVASRYIKDGSTKGWTLKRRIMSLGANKLARMSLSLNNIKDPMSGFFAFSKNSIKDVQFKTKGYKILLEFLVKNRKIKIIEVPYTFSDRKLGQSKMSYNVIIDYLMSVWELYLYDRKEKLNSFEIRNSIKFLSKVGRFFTVGASGLLINYMISFLLSSGLLAKLWYMESTSIGIIISITSNFILNKIWTFRDKDFSPKHTIKQYLLFLVICSLGASLQLAFVYMLVESKVSYELSLLLAVIAASVSNFVLNKKITFKEKIWG